MAATIMSSATKQHPADEQTHPEGGKVVLFLAHEKEPDMKKMMSKGEALGEKTSGRQTHTSRKLFWLGSQTEMNWNRGKKEEKKVTSKSQGFEPTTSGLLDPTHCQLCYESDSHIRLGPTGVPRS
jgi:hypothetical protein